MRNFRVPITFRGYVVVRADTPEDASDKVLGISDMDTIWNGMNLCDAQGDQSFDVDIAQPTREQPTIKGS